MASLYGVSDSGLAFKSEIFCLTVVIVAFSSLLVCIYAGTELETLHKQATITVVKQNMNPALNVLKRYIS